MRVHVERIGFAGAPDELVFAAVQLPTPDLKRVTARKTYKWDPEQEPIRLKQAKAILDRIAAGDVEKSPHVVVFSEYSLPQSAFEGRASIPFQEIADREGWVIVAGSYFDADEANEDTFKCNLCKIYIPQRPSPIVLCKANPAKDELEYLRTSDKLYNVARLIWEVPGKQATSINIFLCRDYLAPFRACDSATADDQEQERVSLLDWERMGINIVVMENEDSSLFEAAAAMDVRRIHGEQRKLVLFVNSANDTKQLATAILGPNNEDERIRDVAARMPSDATGVLIAETNLRHVVLKNDAPDPTNIVPIKHWERFKLTDEDDPKLAKIRKEAKTVKARKIFHPALLSVLEKFIVIELFVARSTQKVQDAFDLERIKYVTASHVRGVEDILIRRYIESTFAPANPGKVPSIAEPHDVPYVKLGPDDFKQAFDFEKQTSFLRALIEPKSIRKFRGVPVKELDASAWQRLCTEILETIHPHRDREEIIRLASECPEDGKIPAKFETVFKLGTEYIVPTGRESGARETYLFLACETLDGSPAPNRFLTFANEHLAGDDAVRDLFVLTLVEVNPPIRRMPLPFQFLLRLKCNVFVADELIGRIQKWAALSGVRIGTRSYDVWKNIIREATQGIIESTISHEQMALQKALCAIDPDFVFETREIMEEFAREIAEHSRSLERVHTPEWRDLVLALTGFFHHVCLYNCVKSPNKKKVYRKEAGNRWINIYQVLEMYCGQLLVLAMGLQKKGRSEIAEGLKKLNEDYFKDKGGDGGLVKWFIDFYGSLVPEKAYLARLVETKHGAASVFRNLAVHGQVADDLDVSIKVAGPAWRENFKALNGRVEAICELLAALSAELPKSTEE
jgi:hypothetical protein